MKYKKLSLLLSVLLMAAVNTYAECECDDGTTDYTIDCDGDGILDACDTSECPPCSDQSPDPATDGYECCGATEFDPAETKTQDNETATHSFVIPEPGRTLLSWLGASASGDLETTTNLWSGKDCCEDSVVDYERGSLNITGDLEWELATQNIPAIKGTINTLNEYAADLGAKVSVYGKVTATASTSVTVNQTWSDCEETITGEWPYTVNVGGSGGATLKSIQSGNTLGGVTFGGDISSTGTVEGWSSLSLQWPSNFENTGCFTLTIDVPFVDFLDVDENWGDDC